MDDAHGAPHGDVQPSAARRAARAEFNYTVHGARGLFAFLIVLYHVINSGLPSLPVLDGVWSQFSLRALEYGVELFFCISGYVITGTLRRARSPAAFLEDRAIRIFPVLWVAIGLIAALRPVMQSVPLPVDGGDVAKGIFVVENLLVFPGLVPIHAIHPAAWSLSYEFGFYLFCALAWLARDRLGGWTVVPMALAAIVLLGTYPRAIYFLVGVIVAVVPLQGGLVARLKRHPLPFLLLFLALWHGIQALTPVPLIDSTLWAWLGDVRGVMALGAVLAAVIGFAGLAAGHGGLGRLLRSPPLLWLGTVSYSLYLWHPLVMSVVKEAMRRLGLVHWAGDWSQVVFLALALPPSLLAAVVSQRVLERGAGMWLRRRLHHRPPLRVAAGVPGQL